MNPSDVLAGSYDYRLVALSVFISILAAYAARDLSERISDARGGVWLAWLAVGAAADGIGTWSMHYTGMLAYQLPSALRLAHGAAFSTGEHYRFRPGAVYR